MESQLNSSDPTVAQQAVDSKTSWLTDPKILPMVSVLIPMYNEEQYIEGCLRSVLSQDYPHDKMEIHVVDSASEDGSVQLVQERFLASGEPVFLHRSPDRKTPRSLNIGLRAASGDIIIYLGAHAEMLPDFIRFNIANLQKDNIYCSGGTLVNVGGTSKQISIGVAMSHPFAMASPHRYRRKPGFLKTVVWGAYRREVFETIGYFEEEGAIPDDAELHCRVLQAGYKIYFDPRIQSRYYPRKTLRSWARQMFRYGYLRNQMFRKYYRGISWFHFVPPICVLALAGLALTAPFYIGARFIIMILGLIYGGLILIFAIDARIRQRKGHLFWIGIAFIATHLAWGLGFLRGFFQPRTQFKEYVR